MAKSLLIKDTTLSHNFALSSNSNSKKDTTMTAEEYRTLWKEAIHLCEIEPNEQEAKAFVNSYYNNWAFDKLGDKELFLTFVGLVVYEQRFQMGFGSTTPASKCYRELLNRIDHLDREFIYDVGDWAAEYSDNDYVPMDTYRGYGPREYYAFWDAYETRIASEQLAKAERIAILREEGRKKVEATKARHKARLEAIKELRNKSVDECIEIIESSGKSVYYYIELIEEWFKSKSLDDETKNYVLSLFPLHSTKHNIRIRKKIEDLY